MTPASEQAEPKTTDAGSDETGGGNAKVGGMRLAGRTLAVIAILGSFIIWIYAFSGAARRDAPDLLDDPAFATEAEPICAAAQLDLDALPNALAAVDGPDRAEQIRTSSARLELMLDDLDQLVGGSDRDVEISGGWLSDWRVLVADRYTYADSIAADPNAQFYVTDVGVSERLDKRITRVANTNKMPSCAAPTDVG